MSRKYSLAALSAAFFAGLVVMALVARSNSVMADVKTYDNLETFANILSLVEQNYVETVEPTKLVEGAINGMLRSLDAHSSYMTPEMYKEMQVETEGEFGGIGIEITIKDDLLTVVAPIEDTPAWDAGIQAGDRIVRVDGESTFDMNLMDAVRKMRGKKGTEVVITIVREGFDQPKDFTIKRDVIHVTSVKYQMLPDGWAYAKVRSFSKDTANDLESAINTMKAEGFKGFILDLRNDPGGLLNQAVAVSELFLEKGEMIVYTRGRMPNQNMEFTSERNIADNDYPMVVLVNKGSASASEIVAGAMQDLKRALVVGTQTFGKGSVQTIIPLRENSGLRLTTAKYYTPLGRQIHNVGIAPDIVIEQRAPDLASVKKEGGPSVRDKVKAKVNGDNGDSEVKKEEEGKEPAKAGEDKAEDSTKPSAVDLEKDYQLQRAIGVLQSWEMINTIRGKNLTTARTKKR
ncbi:MAG: S41 family peptidase [Nitrospinota bacterium]|nr:S41 family peptidase [Nitrospinota bacterium]